jgi:Protein of unknown function (DUF2931)
MNVNNTIMKNSLLLVFFLLFFSCKKSKAEQDRELIEYFKQKESWSAAMSCPYNYLISGPTIFYFSKGKMINNIGTTTTIANSGWVSSSQGRNSGSGTAYPDSVFVSYSGLNDKKETWIYEGGAKLPSKTIEKLFKEGFIDRDKKKNYKEITTGMAPGGRVCVWVDHIEITRFKVNAIQLWRKYPLEYSINKLRERGVSNYINHHSIDYSVWDKPDPRYELDYGFCSEDESNKFFHCFVITKEGVTYAVEERYIDHTFWNESYGEKPNLMEYSGYQQIGNTKKDYKLNLPSEINLIWKKDSTKFYNTNILMPKDLPQRFTKSYTNPITGKKVNYNRIIFGVEKDGEHCVVWLDGPGKQEKMIRFKGQIAKTKENSFINVDYATEVVYY